jgi:hypothetical protein
VVLCGFGILMMNKTTWILAANLFALFALSAIGLSLPLQTAYAAEAPPIVYLFQSFKKAPSLTLPYGDSVLLHAFAKQWDYPPRTQRDKDKDKDKVNVKDKELQPNSLFIDDEKYNELNNFMYRDFESNRLSVSVKNNNLALLFKSIHQATNSIQTERLKSQFKTVKTASTQMRVAQLQNLSTNADITTFSLQFGEKLDCKKCEYPESQRRNLLVNIDSDFNITDALLISASIGGDLGRSERHFYMDTDRTIHLKDFYAGELDGGFQQYYKYKLLPNGKFLKLKLLK